MTRKRGVAAATKHVECQCPDCLSDEPLLKDLEGDLLDLYAEYLGGHFTRSRPTEPGIYGIATLEGDFVGYRALKMVEGELIDTLQVHGEPGWEGWWWSHPLPPPPKGVPN